MPKPSYVPQANKMYISENGEAHLRFNSYKYQALDREEDSEVEVESSNMVKELREFTLDMLTIRKKPLTQSQLERLEFIIAAKSPIADLTYEDYLLVNNYEESKLMYEQLELTDEEHEAIVSTRYRDQKNWEYLFKKTPVHKIFLKTDPRSLEYKLALIPKIWARVRK